MDDFFIAQFHDSQAWIRIYLSFFLSFSWGNRIFLTLVGFVDSVEYFLLPAALTHAYLIKSHSSNPNRPFQAVLWVFGNLAALEFVECWIEAL